MRRKHTNNTGPSYVDLQFDRNPLVRPSDRLQARVKRIATVLMILMVPAAAWFGMATLSEQQSRVAEQQYTRHSVTATTTSTTEPTPFAQSDYSTQNSATVDASWTFQNVEHQGQVAVSTGAPIGTKADIWVDDKGARSTPPLSDGDAVFAALFTGFGSLFAACLIFYGVYAAIRFHLDSRRDAEWDLAIKNFMDENSLN